MKRAIIIASIILICAGMSLVAFAAEPIKIGAIFSITGPNAPLGVPERDTLEMVVEQVNKGGGIKGRKLEAIIMDDAGDETKASLAVKKLIESDKVCAIIGPSLTGTSLAVMPAVESAKIPLISCAAGVKIVEPPRKYVFKTAQSDVHAVAKVIEHLKKQKINRIAFLSVSNAFGNSGKEQMQKQAAKAGIRVVSYEEFGDKDTNMTAQLTAIRAKKPEAIVCWGTNPGPALVARDMKALNLNIPLVMSHGVANKKFIELAGSAAEGVVFPAGKLLVANEIPASDPQKKVLQRFATEFKKKYGREADGFGGYAYDAANIIIRAIRKVGTNPSAIRDEIEKTRMAGVSGVFAFSPDDHNGLTKDAFVMVQIEGDKWKMLK